MKRALLKKKENNPLTPIEEQFLLQTCDSESDSEDETEVENSDDESEKVSSNVKIKISASELCKIISCGSAQVDDLDSVVREYFNKHAVVLDSRNLEYSNLPNVVICAYCPPQTISYEDFLAHTVSAHRSFPILAYDLSEQPEFRISEHDLDNKAEAIVSDFRQQLGIYDNNFLLVSYIHVFSFLYS